MFIIFLYVVSDNDLFRSKRTYRQLLMQFHIEAGHLLYFYYEDTKAHEHFNQAKAASGLAIELKGLLHGRIFMTFCKHFLTSIQFTSLAIGVA